MPTLHEQIKYYESLYNLNKEGFNKLHVSRFAFSTQDTIIEFETWSTNLKIIIDEIRTGNPLDETLQNKLDLCESSVMFIDDLLECMSEDDYEELDRYQFLIRTILNDIGRKVQDIIDDLNDDEHVKPSIINFDYFNLLDENFELMMKLNNEQLKYMLNSLNKDDI